MLFDVAVDFDVVHFSRFESYILVLQSLSDTAAAPYGYQCLANPFPFEQRTNRDDFQEGFILYVNCSYVSLSPLAASRLNGSERDL